MLCLPRNLHFEDYKVLRLPRNLHIEVHQVLCLPRNLHFKASRFTTSAAPRSAKSANEPHVQKSRFTAPVTKSELLDDHHHVLKVLRLLRKIAFRSKTPPILSRKVDFGAPKHEPSLAPATKGHHHVRKCARRRNESAVTTSARSSHPDSASLRSRSAH